MYVFKKKRKDSRLNNHRTQFHLAVQKIENVRDKKIIHNGLQYSALCAMFS